LSLLYDTDANNTDDDIFLRSTNPADHAAPVLVVSGPGNQNGARFSPDGAWFIYTSNESGRWEVYVQSFPASAEKLMVSSAGGAFPLWRDDGKELFYLTEDGRVMSAEIKSGAKIESSVPQQLFFSFAVDPARKKDSVCRRSSLFLQQRNVIGRSVTCDYQMPMIKTRAARQRDEGVD